MLFSYLPKPFFPCVAMNKNKIVISQCAFYKNADDCDGHRPFVYDCSPVIPILVLGPLHFLKLLLECFFPDTFIIWLFHPFLRSLLKCFLLCDNLPAFQYFLSPFLFFLHNTCHNIVLIISLFSPCSIRCNLCDY